MRFFFFLFSYTYQLRGVSSLFSATENAMKQLYFRSRYGRLLVCSPMVDIITICFKFCAEKEEKGVRSSIHSLSLVFVCFKFNR